MNGKITETAARSESPIPRISVQAARCRRKFLKFFPGGFWDETYIAWERGYKWRAHQSWTHLLNQHDYRALLKKNEFGRIASIAVGIESKTNMLFSFEKMALRDAVKVPEGAKVFAEGLYRFLYGAGSLENKFDGWCKTVESLPKKQSRVFTHPVTTIFGLIALPKINIFLKPTVTRTAAREYGFDFQYASRPSWKTYSSLLAFAERIRYDLKDMKPRDMIDIQSFIWVLGSSEYD